MSAWVAYFLRKAGQSIRQSPLVQLVALSTIAISMIVLGDDRHIEATYLEGRRC